MHAKIGDNERETSSDGGEQAKKRAPTNLERPHIPHFKIAIRAARKQIDCDNVSVGTFLTLWAKQSPRGRSHHFRRIDRCGCPVTVSREQNA
jgi:hypothetical protein